VAQGALEGSNVRAIVEMARLMEVSRAYQNLSGLLQHSDDLRRTAIERLGQVQA
jgi:flagellar basal-body rod protein FlgF